MPEISHTIDVEYFAILREERGCPYEAVVTEAATPRALYDELRKLHGFSLGPERMKVVVNEEFAPWDHPLQAGDTVVFVPPVAGG